MFKPTYSLSTTLLNNIVRIKNLVGELNNRKFPSLVLAHFEKESYSLSSHASTSIEGNPLPLTDVRRLLKSAPSHLRDTEKEVLNYNNALKYLDASVKKQKRVTPDFICHIQSLVTKGLLTKKNIGKFRQEPVVVNDPRRRAVAYIPPDASDIKPLTLELTRFLETHHVTLDPLILAGIFHKQFVIIHPFMDGNLTTRTST
jgi:Fic family protein